MEPADELRATGDRIEELFDRLQGTADPRTLATAEELLRSVSLLYGAGIARMVELARADAPALVDSFADDELVASLLLATGIHPEPLSSRVEGALERVRPFLGAHGGDVELLGVDDDAGEVRLRLLGSCDGCPSSAVTLRSAVEAAILESAPEVVRIEVDQPSQETAPVAVSLGAKPKYEECPAEVVGA
ncbi:MAG TPA: NifU family protein [Acidimicrobiales bacterium]|nr:NifU family protein [Acidimicrobiales bacterium]